jgi:hypothetical protein
MNLRRVLRGRLFVPCVRADQQVGPTWFRERAGYRACRTRIV